MNKVLSNPQLISALGQINPYPNRKHLLNKHKFKNLTRAWRQGYARYKKSRTVVLHGKTWNAENFWIPSSEARNFSGPLETLKTKLLSQREIGELEELPDMIRQIRVLDVFAQRIPLLTALFDLPWGSCLTQVNLFVPEPEKLGRVVWPGSIRILDIETSVSRLMALNLPKGLESFGFKTTFFTPILTFLPEFYWPKSLLTLKIPSGWIKARPEAFPNLKTALVDRFEDLEDRAFLPQNLEAWSGTDYEDQLEAPKLKMARIPRICIKESPRLFCLESIRLVYIQDFQALTGFCNLTCLGIKAFRNSLSLQVPSSVTSLWLSKGVNLNRMTLPPDLRALRFHFDPSNMELVLPSSLEFLQIHSLPTQIHLSPLSKLRFLYLKLGLTESGYVCSLSVRDYPGQVPYGSLCVREDTLVDIPQLGLHRSCQNPGFIYFKRGTPDWSHGPYQALRILDPSS